MKVVTIAGAKGGTAKTTTALALAYELAATGLRVALADCDPQASATVGLRQAPAPAPLSNPPVQLELDLCAQRAAGGSGGSTGELWLFRSGRTLATATKAQVRAHLARVPADTDVLVVDTVPTVGPITIAALEAADLVIIPLPPAPYPVAGLFDLLHTATQVSPLARLRALLSLVKSRRTMAAQMAARIAATRPGLLYEAQIPDDAQCEWAAQAFQPVPMFAPRSRAARAFRALATEVAHDLGLRIASGSLAGRAVAATLAAAGGAHVAP